ncbi:hypothetical protein UQW22_09850 [Isoptericola halotolerans]|uniref:hypothetical protein n=1 Tax=Isoptericola halotolerans TaxID=300560 RepID=UPI00388F98DA
MTDADGWKGRRAEPAGAGAAVMGYIRDLYRRVEALNSGAPLSNASISRGGLQIKDGGDVTIHDGGQLVVDSGFGPLIRFDNGSMWMKNSAADDEGRVVAGESDGGGPAIWLLPPFTAARTSEVENAVIVGGRTPTDPGSVWIGTQGQLHATTETNAFVTAQAEMQVSAGDNMFVTAGSDVVLRGDTGLSLRATTGSVALAAEDGSLSLLQDSDDQWLLGRSSGTPHQTYAYSGSGSDDLWLVAPGTVRVSNNFTVNGTKNFRIPHPTKPGLDLMHGSTESPVSGVEYWGESTIGPDGEVSVDLPDYFEALVKPEGRAVFVTPIGAPTPLGASRVTAGTFTVYGQAGTEFSWLVKGARVDANFPLEPVTDNPNPQESTS